MNKTCTKILIFTIFTLVFSGSTEAQKISEEMCNLVFDSVVSVLKPTKVYRRHIYSADCVFEFDVENNNGVSILIEQSESEEAVIKSFSENSKDAYGDRRKNSLVPRNSTKYWDDVRLFRSTRKFDSFLLLRKKNILLQIFSDNERVLLILEKQLRRVVF